MNTTNSKRSITLTPQSRTNTTTTRDVIASQDLSSNNPEQEGAFVSLARQLMTCADTGQIQHVARKFANVCRAFAEIHRKRGDCRIAIVPLKSAIARLDPDAKSVTPCHVDFLRACLLSKFYGCAMRVIDEHKTLSVNPAKTGLTLPDFLQYCYYAGMVCIGEKHYKQAMRLLLGAITVPAVALSAIMIAAYKKYILLSLIVHSQLVPLPRYASQFVSRNIGSVCEEYQELATAFGSHEMESVAAVIAKHEAVYDRDHNHGLVRQCERALCKKVIQRLTQTYLTLSLGDIASTAPVADAAAVERLVVSMIEGGEIFASVNQREGMVSFYEDTEEYNTNETLRTLQAEITGAIQVMEEIRATDEDLSCNRTYLQNTTMKDSGRFAAEANLPDFASPLHNGQ